MHEAQPVGTVVGDRYRLLGVLGKGGSGLTYRAQDITTGDRVALKELSLRGLGDWKKLELFEREARVLATLDHPAIPNYVDYFQVDTPDNRLFYIAQALAEGDTLAEQVAAGAHFGETEVKRVAQDLLRVLKYLHRLNPPIIHRDIKPQNLIRRDDGAVFLVDFGAVQAVYRQVATFGSTVVGTYGYMAPEQFRGQAYPATDLYGLGATLLYLLTHQDPGELPQTRLKIDFYDHVTVSDDFADWLDGLIEPLVEDRFSSAAAALSALTAPEPQRPDSPPPLLPQHPKPLSSRVQLRRRRRHLILKIPAPGLQWEVLEIAVCALMCFLIPGSLPFFLPLRSLFWLTGAALVILLVALCLGQVFLEIKGDRITLTRQFLGWKRTHRVHTDTLKSVGLSSLPVKISDRPLEAIVLRENRRVHRFGTLLTPQEKDWIVAELRDFLQPPT